jgi:hypothetical protein
MAKNKKFIWKIWLRRNPLTKDVDNDYIAEVSTVGDTARNEDVVQAIVDEGSEVTYDTLLSILNKSDRIKRTFLVSGRGIQDGVVHTAPRGYGPWTGENAKFDENVNSLGFDMTPAPELKELLKFVKVDVLGVKDSGAYIARVVDAATGDVDDIITPGDDVIIEGSKIKIFPEDEEGLGVFFTNVESGEIHRVTRRLTQNNPKTVIARTPELTPGNYSISIVTRFSNSKQLLKSPRYIVYERNLIIQ